MDAKARERMCGEGEDVVEIGGGLVVIEFVAVGGGEVGLASGKGAPVSRH